MIGSLRSRIAWKLVHLAQRISPEPLVVMASRDTVKVIPGGYQINVPGTDTPLAKVTYGSISDSRPGRS